MTTILANDKLAQPGGNQKPRWPFRVNESSWQSDGLVFWLPFMNRGSVYPLGPLAKGPDTPGSGASWQANKFGGLNYHGEGSGSDQVSVFDVQNAVSEFAHVTWTLWFRHKDTDKLNNGWVSTRHNGGDEMSINGYNSGGDERIRLYVNDSNGLQTISINNFNTSAWAFVVGQVDEGNQISLTYNSDVNHKTSSFASWSTGYTKYIVIGARKSDGLASGVGDWLEFRMYDRLFSRDEIRALYANGNPYAVGSDLYEPVVA